MNPFEIVIKRQAPFTLILSFSKYNLAHCEGNLPVQRGTYSTINTSVKLTVNSNVGFQQAAFFHKDNDNCSGCPEHLVGLST